LIRIVEATWRYNLQTRFKLLVFTQPDEETIPVISLRKATSYEFIQKIGLQIVDRLLLLQNGLAVGWGGAIALVDSYVGSGIRWIGIIWCVRMRHRPAIEATMTIALKPEQEQLILAQVATGRYADSTEVIDRALQLLVEEAAWIEETREKVAIGVAELDRGEGMDGPTIMNHMLERFQKARESSES
jgi:antitoxin ParD1/3/4